MSTKENTLNSNLPIDDEPSKKSTNSNKDSKKDVAQFTTAMLQYYKENGFRAHKNNVILQEKVNILEAEKQDNETTMKQKDIEINALQSKIDELQEENSTHIQKMLLVTLERISEFDTRYNSYCQDLNDQHQTKLDSIYLKVQGITEKLQKALEDNKAKDKEISQLQQLLIEKDQQISNNDTSLSERIIILEHENQKIDLLNEQLLSLKEKNENLEEKLNSVEKKNNEDIEIIKEEYETKINNEKNRYEAIIAELQEKVQMLQSEKTTMQDNNDKQLVSLQSENHELNQAVETLKVQLQEKESTISILEKSSSSQNSDLQKCISDLTKEKEEKAIEVNELKSDIE